MASRQRTQERAALVRPGAPAPWCTLARRQRTQERRPRRAGQARRGRRGGRHCVTFCWWGRRGVRQGGQTATVARVRRARMAPEPHSLPKCRKTKAEQRDSSPPRRQRLICGQNGLGSHNRTVLEGRACSRPRARTQKTANHICTRGSSSSLQNIRTPRSELDAGANQQQPVRSVVGRYAEPSDPQQSSSR